MTRNKVLVLAVVGLMAGSSEVFGGTEYGPYDCGNMCARNGVLGSPIPGDEALAFLQQKITSLRSQNLPVDIGDSIKVCNARHCVVYERRNEQIWNGSAPENRQIGNGVGSGGDSGGGPGSNPTNGGIGGGTGGGGGTRTTCGYVNGVRSTCIVG